MLIENFNVNLLCFKLITMKTISLVFLSFFISNIAFCQEDKADYNDDYWSFGTKDVA